MPVWITCLDIEYSDNMHGELKIDGNGNVSWRDAMTGWSRIDCPVEYKTRSNMQIQKLSSLRCDSNLSIGTGWLR